MTRVTPSMNNSQPSSFFFFFNFFYLCYCMQHNTLSYCSLPICAVHMALTYSDWSRCWISPQKEDIIKWKLYHRLNFWLSNYLRYQSSTLNKLFFLFFPASCCFLELWLKDWADLWISTHFSIPLFISRIKLWVICHLSQIQSDFFAVALRKPRDILCKVAHEITPRSGSQR